MVVDCCFQPISVNLSLDQSLYTYITQGSSIVLGRVPTLKEDLKMFLKTEL